jgi:hypothetical protein
MDATPAAHPADTLTPQQRAVLDRLAAGHVPAWLIVYPDGMTATLQDQGGAIKHAAGSHGIRLPLTVPAEALKPTP